MGSKKAKIRPYQVLVKGIPGFGGHCIRGLRQAWVELNCICWKELAGKFVLNASKWRAAFRFHHQRFSMHVLLFRLRIRVQSQGQPQNSAKCWKPLLACTFVILLLLDD